LKSTTRFNKNERGIECLNCKQPISNNDNFCSNCGQVNDELPLSIKQFISEFFAGFFSFDTRFFKTFIPLIFKPGKVSKDYIIGKRRRYVNPFQLYLHVTILFFLIQGIFSAIDKYKIAEVIPEETAIEIEKDSIENNDIKHLALKDSINSPKPSELNEFVQLLNVELEDELDEGGKATLDSIKSIINTPKKKLNLEAKTTLIKTRIDSIFKNSALVSQLKDSKISEELKDSIYKKYFNSNVIYITQFIANNQNIQDWKAFKELSKFNNIQISYTKEKLVQNEITYNPPKETLTSIEDGIISTFMGDNLFSKISKLMAYDKEHENSTPIEALDSLGYENTRWNVFYFKKAQDFNKLKDDEGQWKNYLDEGVSKISIALFFLLPVFTLFLSLIYYRHKRNYTEHLVFVFNIQTVFFLLLLFSIIINRIINTDIGFILSAFTLIFLFYLYKSLRNFYKQGRWKTLIKFVLLNLAYFFLASIGALIVGFTTIAL
jgi:hypothetical protein